MPLHGRQSEREKKRKQGDTITLGVRVQCMNFGGHKHSIHKMLIGMSDTWGLADSSLHSYVDTECLPCARHYTDYSITCSVSQEGGETKGPQR